MSLHIWLRARDDDGERQDKYNDITALCGGLTLQGEVKQASRKLCFDVIRDDADYYLSSHVKIRRGDGIVVTDTDTINLDDSIFFGIIWSVTEDDTEMLKSVTCYDNMRFLMISDVLTNVWMNVTAKEVTETVCKELGVTMGEVPDTDVKISVNARDKSGYEAIMIAWTETHKQTEKFYYPRMVGYKLHVIEKGEMLEGHDLKYLSQPVEGNLISVKVEEDSCDAISALYNRSADGALTFKESDKELVKLYGYIVGVNDDGQTSNQKSVKEINDGKKTVNVSAIGDWAVQTGWSLRLISKLITVDKLYIESDFHSYENGIHTMTLSLSYENSMDAIENQKEETKGGDFSFGGGYTDEELTWNFLRSIGATAEAAAGIMGVWKHESGVHADVEQIGGGGGYGLAQWTGVRRTALVNWCNANEYSYKTMEGQLHFFEYELKERNQEYLLKITSVADATARFLADFEGGGTNMLQTRLNYANDYYSRWHAYTVIPPHGGAGDGVYTGNIGWPFAGGRGTVMQRFGGHRGWDISTTGGYGAGSPVLAVDGGVVVGAGWQLDDWSYGNAVTIRHSSGLCTRYAHLYRIDVSAGMPVSKGQQIGIEGNTGNSYGTHLHLEFLRSLPWGQLIDPATFYG